MMEPQEVWFEVLKIRLQCCPRQYMASLAADADAAVVEYYKRRGDYFSRLIAKELYGEFTSAADAVRPQTDEKPFPLDPTLWRKGAK
jgi:hypothetical protein